MKRAVLILALACSASLAGEEARLDALRADAASLRTEIQQGRERLRREGGSLATEGERAWWDLPTRRRRESRLRRLDLMRSRLEALEARLAKVEAALQELEAGQAEKELKKKGKTP